MTINELQKQLNKIGNEIRLAIQHDAPRADILALVKIQNTIGSQIMGMLRGN